MKKHIYDAVRRRIGRLRKGVRVVPEEMYLLFEQQHLRRLLPLLGVDCVFDVGANSGQYAKMLRTKAGFAGRIVSFEPIPQRADDIRSAAAKDGLWHVEQIALSDKCGETSFSVMVADGFSTLGTPIHHETGRFTQYNVADRRIAVETETLESAYIRLKSAYGFKRPFLKMDTQGFDVVVLKSGSEIARQFVGLQSELSIRRIYAESVEFREALSVYFEMGFELSAFVPNNGGHFPQLVEMDCIMIRSDLMPRG
jgi:FkbM family methyltransferase